jgi:hypothetical protein
MPPCSIRCFVGRIRTLLLCAGMAFSVSSCASKLHFTSNPSGAPLYFKERNDWIQRGVTPCTVEMYGAFDRDVALIGNPGTSDHVVINLNPTFKKKKFTTYAAIAYSGAFVTVLSSIGNSMGGVYVGVPAMLFGALMADASDEYPQANFHLELNFGGEEAGHGEVPKK